MTRLAIGLAGLLAPALLQGQSLARRITGARDGEVRIAFAAREGICGDGESFIRDRRHEGFITMREWPGTGKRNWRFLPCEDGPVRVSLRVREGAVRSNRVYVGGEWPPAGGGSVTDLGRVGAKAAALALIELARGAETDRGRGMGDGDVLFAATLADSIVIWPELLRLARDKTAPRSSRKQAVFWLSQAAGDKATEGLAELVGDDLEDREVREQAVFALSQLPDETGVPTLVRVAKTSKDPKVRRNALFWLGQSEDPRALALFEELLTKP